MGDIFVRAISAASHQMAEPAKYVERLLGSDEESGGSSS
jgi:hypothetical protein